MTRFETYRRLFPNLPFEAIQFFCSANCESTPTLRFNKVGDFYQRYRSKYSCDMPQPQVVDQICQRLSEFGWMSPGRTGTFNCMDNEYITFINNTDQIKDNPSVTAIMRCAVYGFPEVFDLYKNSVVPLVSTDTDGNKQIGSSFVINESTLGTAWHCLEGASALSIKDIPSESSFEISKHKEEQIDVALLKFSGQPFKSALPFAFTKASVLDDVVILGYPNIPGYIPNIAGEKALISSKLTALEGHIGSEVFEIWSRENVFLLTSRVRGGFSGGPVIDRLGQCVGLVARDPLSGDAEGIGQAYDKLGYGVAMPASLLEALVTDPEQSIVVDTSNIKLEKFS